MFVIEIYRAYTWFMGSDPITTYYLTSEPAQAVRFPTHEAAMAAITYHYNGHHNSHINRHRWAIKAL